MILISANSIVEQLQAAHDEIQATMETCEYPVLLDYMCGQCKALLDAIEIIKEEAENNGQL